MTRVPVKGLRGAVILHRCLVAGLLAISGIIAFLAFRGGAPLMPPDDTASLIGKVMAGIGVSLIAIGLIIFRPRMPEFVRSHPNETYWDSPKSLEAAQRVWFLLDGAGTMCLVAVLLTGQLAPIVVAALAIGAMVMSGPGRLERS